MARNFSGTDEEIRCSIGSCNLTGAWTIVAVVQRANTSSYHNLLTVHTSAGVSQYGLEIESNTDGNQLQVQSGNTGFTASTFTVMNTEGWVLVAGGKATGTVTPRVHKYVYGTDTWTHQNASGTLGNPASTAAGTVRFGEWEDLDDFAGDVTAAAIFDRSLTDDEVEQMAHDLMAWVGLAPVGMWVLDQAAVATTVNDWTGNGAQQSTITGTTVSATSAPIGYGASVHMGTFEAAAGASTNASAECATGAGAADNATAKVDVAVGSADGTGAANDSTSSVAVQAECATGTGTANNPTTQLAVASGSADGTGTAPDSGAAVSVQADVATGTGTANDATVSTAADANAPAGVASGTGTANDATASLASADGGPTGAGTAGDAGPSVAVAADQATGSGIAGDSSASVAAGPSSADGTGTANPSGPTVAVNAECATGTGTAPDPTVSTETLTNASAESASGTGAANAPATSLAINADAAGGMGAVDQPSAGIGPPADAAIGTGTANNATILTGAEPTAGLAGITGIAGDGAVAVLVYAEVASALGEAWLPSLVRPVIPLYDTGGGLSYRGLDGGGDTEVTADVSSTTVTGYLS